MAGKDLGCKILLDIDEVFADVFNVCLFKGKELIKPEALSQAQERSQFHAGKGYHEQVRDVSKFWNKCDIRIAFFGIENENKASRDMPLRIMSYDGGVYREQLSTLKDDYISGDGYVNGDGSNDTPADESVESSTETKAKKKKKRRKRYLYPVISLVLNFNTKRKWSTPKNLKGVLDIPDELQEYVNDYHIHVIDIPFLEREVIDSFKSDFWFVADYFWQLRNNKNYQPSEKEIKYAHQVLQMMSAMTGDKRFEEVYNEEKNEQGGGKNMCEYLDRIVANGENREREKSIRVLVKALSEAGASDDFIIEKIAENYDLTTEQAAKKVEKCRPIPA